MLPTTKDAVSLAWHGDAVPAPELVVLVKSGLFCEQLPTVNDAVLFGLQGVTDVPVSIPPKL